MPLRDSLGCSYSGPQVVGLDEFNLTDKERQFCLEYLKDLSPAQAALRAGYSKSYGADLVKRAEIDRAIQFLMVERAKSVGVDAVQVVEEVLAMARELRSRQLWTESIQAYKLVLSHLGGEKGGGGSATAIQINIGRDATDKELERNKELDGSATLILGRPHGAGAIQLPARQSRPRSSDS